VTSLLIALRALPWPIAGGWILCLAWAALQMAWYRRLRIVPPPVVQPLPASERAMAARAARRTKAANTIVDTLPPIDLDSMPAADIAAPSQTVLGL